MNIQLLRALGGLGGGGVTIFDDPTTFDSSVVWNATNQNLKDCISNVKIYGGNPAHRYHVWYTAKNGTGGRNRVYIINADNGQESCQYIDYVVGKTGTQVCKLVDVQAPTDAITIFVWVDWDLMASNDKGAFTVTNARIDPAAIIPKTEIQKFLQKQLIKQTTTIANAPNIIDSCYHNQYQIDLPVGDTLIGNHTIPQFFKIKGQGKGVSIVKTSEVYSSTNPIFQNHFSTVMEDMTIQADMNGYCIHSDVFNTYDSLFTAIYQIFKNIAFVGTSNQLESAYTWLLGVGASSAQVIKVIGCNGGHTNPSYLINAGVATYGFHNTADSAEAVNITLQNCASTDQRSVQLMSLGSGRQDICNIINCNFDGFVENYVGTNWKSATRPIAKNRLEWAVLPTGTLKYKVTDLYSSVLRITTVANDVPITVSGTAASVIFGNIATRNGSNGLKGIVTGDKSVDENITYNAVMRVQALGTLLGDCSSVNKTLIVNVNGTEITHTFNTNLTNATNSTILAAINATIGSIATASTYLICWDDFPSWGKISYTNNTGLVILKGKIIMNNGAVVGVALSDILPNETVQIIGKNYPVHKRWLGITGTVTTGEFGVTNGVPDYGAATKVGITDSLEFFTFY